MKGKPPSKAEKEYHDMLCRHVGCIACRMDGRFNDYVSIHHIDGRTKKGAHMKVLPLCAGHHQSCSGGDPTMIAVHPFKARFEAKYGTQSELLEKCNEILKRKGLL